MKYLFFIICLFASTTVFSQSLQKVGTQEGLPVFKEIKDLTAGATLIGYKQIGDSGVTTKLYQKVSKTGKVTCFFISTRDKATKTKEVGTPYKKSCNCPIINP